MKVSKKLSVGLCVRFISLAVVLTLSACGSDKDDGDSKPQPTNSGDEASFKVSGASMLEMVKLSKRDMVVESSKFKSSKLTSFHQIEAFMGDPADGADDVKSVGSDECPSVFMGETSFFEVEDSNEGDSTADDGFNITQGQSCADALGELKSSYSSILNQLEGQVNSLVNLDPAKMKGCGVKAERADMPKDQAAIAWKLTDDTVAGASDGIQGSAVIYGGAIGNIVTIGSTFEGKFQFDGMADGYDPDDGNIDYDDNQVSRSGSGGMEMPVFTFSGKNKTSGDLLARTLDTNYSIATVFKDNSPGAKNSMSFIMAANSRVAGLAEGQKLKVEETASFDVNAGGEAMSGSFKINVEETGKDEMKIAGSADFGPNQKETFSLTLAKGRNGDCRVVEYSGNSK